MDEFEILSVTGVSSRAMYWNAGLWPARKPGIVKSIKMKKLLLYSLLAVPVLSTAQDEGPKHLEASGYIKNMQTMVFYNLGSALSDPYQQINLIHNRINASWAISDELRLQAALRTRVFYGDLNAFSNPGSMGQSYGDLIDNENNDYLDLSLVLLDDKSWVVHSMLDRLYLEYIKGDWEVRLGRQRINWGVSTVWNPNDIFNAFSFTDFDYEERPGSDALRIRRYTGFASSIELAVRMFDDFDEAVIAGLWKFNRGSYDFQVLGGYARQDLVLGGGWAGNLGNAGLKGEFTFFSPLEEERDEAFAATVGLDYSFSNSLYVNAGYLYNSAGSVNASIIGLFDFALSARNLYPYRHAVFTQLSYPITPLLNGSVAFIYSPVEAHALFANPALSLSIKENWDLGLVGQIIMDKEADGYTSPIQAAFLRLKFSY